MAPASFVLIIVLTVLLQPCVFAQAGGTSTSEITDWQRYDRNLGSFGVLVRDCWHDLNGNLIPRRAISLRLYKVVYDEEWIALGVRRVETNDATGAVGTSTLDLGEWSKEKQCYLTLPVTWRYSKSANKLEQGGDHWTILQQTREYDEFAAIADSNAKGDPEPCTSISETTEYIQLQLRKQLGAEVEDNGRWNAQTNRALRVYLKALLEREPWKEGWDKPTDTDYTDEVAAHLRASIAAVELELGGKHPLTDNLTNMIRAMDCLKASDGGYSPDVGEEALKEQGVPNADTGSPLPVSPAPSPASPSGNAGSGFLLSFFNGFLYEFADEIGCKVFFADTFDACHEKAKQDVLAAQAAAGMFTAILNFIGILLSPIGSMFAVSRARSLHKTGGSAFLLGFKYEFFENMLMAIGEISTFGTLQNPEAFAQWGLAACVLTGIMVSVRSR